MHPASNYPRMRKPLILALALVTAITVLPAAAGAQVGNLPPYPARSEWYAENDSGHFTGGEQPYVRIDEGCAAAAEPVACSLEAFRAQPFTVIAFVDSGANLYHQDFRAPEFVHHPATYVEGFPADAAPIDLSLDLADAEGYEDAREADDEMLQELERNRLYWVPGTRVIGGYSTRAGGTQGGRTDHEILDENGHGTGVASVAAGRFFGANPNALIVVVEGLGDASLTWATSQPWIDIVSNSWGNIGNLPLGATEATRAATERGQTVAFAAGNGATNTNSSCLFAVPCVPAVGSPVPPTPLPIDDPCECKTPDSNPSVTSPYGGPSWILTVGAASPINGQAHWWHSVPVDVSSFGSKWRAAAVFGVGLDANRDFGGTSCATPVTSGVLSLLIQTARDVLGDTVQGQRPGQAVAVAAAGVQLPAAGPLADGVLTRLEAEELVTKTAFPVEADPEALTWDYAVRPTTDAYYVYQGYGVVDRGSRDRALAVLLGEAQLADRSDVDAWLEQVDAARDAIWG